MSGLGHRAVGRRDPASTRSLSTLGIITALPTAHSQFTKLVQDRVQSVAGRTTVLEKQQRPAQAHYANLLYEGGELQVASPAIKASRARHCPPLLHCTHRVSMVFTASASRRGHPTFHAHQVKKQDILTLVRQAMAIYSNHGWRENKACPRPW